MTTRGVKDWTYERTCYISFRPQGARFKDHLKAIMLKLIILFCVVSFQLLYHCKIDATATVFSVSTHSLNQRWIHYTHTCHLIVPTLNPCLSTSLVKLSWNTCKRFKFRSSQLVKTCQKPLSPFKCWKSSVRSNCYVNIAQGWGRAKCVISVSTHMTRLVAYDWDIAHK